MFTEPFLPSPTLFLPCPRLHIQLAMDKINPLSASSPPSKDSSTAHTKPTSPSYDSLSPLPGIAQRLSMYRDPRTQAREIEKLVAEAKAQDLGFLWLSKISQAIYKELQALKGTRHLRYFYISPTQKLRIRIPRPAHEGIVICLRGMIDTKLTSVGVLGNTCVPHGSPDITFGGITAQPDGGWGPLNMSPKDRTVIFEVGDSKTATELTNDARHWIEHAQSSVQIYLTIKLNKNPDSMTLLVWRRQTPAPTGHNLRSRHDIATLTDSVTITRGTNTVHFANPSLLPLPPASITMPTSAFTGDPFLQGSITLTSQDLVNLGRACWVPAYGF